MLLIYNISHVSIEKKKYTRILNMKNEEKTFLSTKKRDILF